MVAINMMDLLIDHPNIAQVLFKPVQLHTIEKIVNGAPLTKNEERYMRGNLGKKINALHALININEMDSNHSHSFLSSLDTYYISGHEALKRNGFGWFYDANIIIVMNTSLKGSIRHNGKKYIFIRTRSMKNRSRFRDPTTGIFYATNEQIIRDAFELKDESLIRTWNSMLVRYGPMFVENPEQFDRIRESIKKHIVTSTSITEGGGSGEHRMKQNDSFSDDLEQYGV